MRRAPLNNNFPNWDHEIGELVEPSNTLREPSEGAAAALRVPLLSQRVSRWGRVGLLCLLVLAGLALVGDNSEVHDPAPGSHRAWMGKKLAARP